MAWDPVTRQYVFSKAIDILPTIRNPYVLEAPVTPAEVSQYVLQRKETDPLKWVDVSVYDALDEARYYHGLYEETMPSRTFRLVERTDKVIA